jgi:adenosine deaminase
MKIEKEYILKIPKIELHLHLDCSLSYNVLKQLHPQISKKEYLNSFTAPEKSTDLADFLRCASNGINMLQTEDALRIVVQDLFAQLERDNVIYAEIRFAPLLHVEKGLRTEEVVEIIDDSISNNCTKTGIKVGLILCTLRHFSEQQSFQTIRLVELYIKNTSVVGFDIAGNEAGYPIDAHVKAFRYAEKMDISRTAHAGEARGPESVWETITHFKPQRIGHGVRSIEDEKLVEFLIKNDLYLEINPTCNIQTDIYKEYSDHPVNNLFRSGVSLGISTDGRSLSNITLSEEYYKLSTIFGWKAEDFRTCNINSILHAFISQGEKENLSQLYNSRFNSLME